MNQPWQKESVDGERSAVKITREFDFPRELVFTMLTDPKKAVKVWGPEGAEKLVFELDPRPGGAITIVDRWEGKTAKTSGTITEFVVPELLAFRSSTIAPEGTAPWVALQTVTLEELSPRRTRVTISVKILETGSFPGGVESLEEGFQGGWGQTLHMLQRELR
ncbi:MAG: SRPBCC domain-containing protein [Thermoplasmata archaeon]